MQEWSGHIQVARHVKGVSAAEASDVAGCVYPLRSVSLNEQGRPPCRRT